MSWTFQEGEPMVPAWWTPPVPPNMGMPSSPDISFYTPLFVFIGMLGSFAIILVICFACCKKCRKPREPQLQETTVIQHIPPPAAYSIPPSTAPPGPTAPPLIQASEPPPYSEVVDKSYFYPAPVGQPPFYDNIAMEDLSRELSLQEQRSRIISERSSVSAANTLGH